MSTQYFTEEDIEKVFTCKNTKTTDQLMNKAARLIIQAAKLQSEDFGYPLDEALGDLIGSMPFQVDAELYNPEKPMEVRPTETKQFLAYLKQQIDSYILQANASRTSSLR